MARVANPTTSQALMDEVVHSIVLLKFVANKTAFQQSLVDLEFVGNVRRQGGTGGHKSEDAHSGQGDYQSGVICFNPLSLAGVPIDDRLFHGRRFGQAWIKLHKLAACF
ncbi:hypothetical protein FOQG_00336 [Fusarium oxysporum f. sp. raphani 54005]|uniref:Uncharacterized protein n=1 Tax=Fusarium oxysporum f. sp. raphani 54005 TaxID=1089458 RepID=X0E0X4_FUSOX|nr:hypothetical protein FOQG_00336 [Fusarium oxysporum f. sp. raphani 54005]EXK99993.1 hypothetical protein FOQG_00336 [Fusarium oxysporum f. sp. raphani 54005]EXK99994.1 hypothetical protein FOQG_00336 [Fusarium oxysporum f. sp. raphani 54005]